MDLVLISVMAWLLFLFAASLLASALYFGSRRRMRGLHPRPRAALLRLLSLAPGLLASFGLVLCFAPKLLRVPFPELDHCNEHTDGHPHFCFAHAPDLDVRTAVWVFLGLVLVGLVALAWRRVRAMRGSIRALEQLTSTAQFDERHDAWIVDTEQPVAISVGLLRSRILLSTGLLAWVPERLVEAIIAHERAHDRRRDGLWRLWTEWLSHGHLPATRRRLRAELDLACEQACDEEAGAALRSRLQVAEALLVMERLRHRIALDGHGAMAFGASGLAQRVESLAADSAGRSAHPGWVFLAVLLVLAGAIFVADPLHHFTETLIHRLWP